jgi:hypothetical protein
MGIKVEADQTTCMAEMITEGVVMEGQGVK